MSSDRLERVQRIVERVARVAPDLRGSFVRSLCNGDEKLLAEVLDLIPHYERMASFEPARPDGSLLGLPGTTTFAQTAAHPPETDELAEHELTPPFCLGQCTATSVLGRGGMGVVYRGVQASIGRSVAIKVLRASCSTPEHRRRFALEAEILRRLHHPGIARLIHADTFEAPFNPRPYLIMEYIPGEPITRYVEEHALGARARMELLVRVCEAVEYAHERAIVHCDLKPANILVMEEGTEAQRHRGTTPQRHEGTEARNQKANGHGDGIQRSLGRACPKILDFGVSRVVAFESWLMSDARPRFIGTPEYASPEQLAGRIDRLGPACDVYSLALIAHELLTGQLPRRADGRLVLDLRGIRLEGSVAPDNPGEAVLRHELAKILAKALPKNPAARYASAGDLGRALERLLARFPVRSSRWETIKNRIRSLGPSRGDRRPSSVGSALRLVMRSRIAGAMRPSAADMSPGSPDTGGGGVGPDKAQAG